MLKYIIAFLLLCGSAHGQEESIIRLYNPVTEMQGSAVIISKVREYDTYYLALASTAYHIVADKEDQVIPGSPFIGVFNDETQARDISCAVFSKKDDIALVWLMCPNYIPPVQLADNSYIKQIDMGYNPERKVRASFIGYGHGYFMRHHGYVSFIKDNFITSDAIVTPGQSGGAMFVGGKLAGVIGGGHADYDAPNGAVWPAICANSNLIPGMIRQALENPPK
jgi:S1-C subfamily serine protease